MSVAVLTADTSVKAVASRTDSKSGKTDKEAGSDFKTLVKGEAGGDAAAAQDAKKRGVNQGETAETGNDGDDSRIWRRYGTLFERSADSVQEGKNADESTDEAENAEEPDGTAGIVNIAAAVSGKANASKGGATADKPAIAQEKVAPANMGADGKAVSDAARNAEAPADAKAMTPGALPGGAAAVMGPRTETPVPGQSQVQVSRAASADQAAGASQSSGQGVPLSKGNAGDDSAADGDGGKRDGQGQDHPSRLAQPQGGNRIAGVSVVSQQVTPAAMTPTGAAFVDSLAAGVAKAEHAEMTNQPTFAQSASKPGPITTLRIQLQPAELGMVTARLSGTGAQLSVEITVENAEARHRLTSDSDAIVTALRGLGIDIDRVTVQQSQSNSGSTPGNGGRGNEFAQSGDNRGDQQGQASRQESGRGHGGDIKSGQGNANTDISGGGVYI